MISADGLDISIHRGNVGYVTFCFEGEDTPDEGTIIEFMVKKSPSHIEPAIYKIAAVTDGEVTFIFEKEDTEHIVPAEYHWNLRILYTNGEEPWTVLEPASKFTVLPEDGSV